jgi:hypothetical protein
MGEYQYLYRKITIAKINKTVIKQSDENMATSLLFIS